MADSTVLAGLLRHAPLFDGLAHSELEMVLTRCRRERRPAGSILFLEGESGHCLYVVISGRVKVERRKDPGAPPVYLASRGPGEHIGEMAVVEDALRSATAITETDCELLVLDRDDFRYCLERSHRLALNLIHLLAARLREAASSLETRQRLGVSARLSLLLLDMAETSGTTLPDNEVRVELRASQSELAARVGATRESINRALNRLRTLGAVRREGTTLIVRPSVLRRYIT